MTIVKTRPMPGRVQERPTKGTRGQRTLLVVHLAGQAYGIPLKEVREVVPMAQLSRLPGLPPVLAGFLNLAGTAIPVLRLSHLFGLPDQPTGLYTPLVVLRHPDSHLALLVEKVSRIMSVSADAILPIPEDHSFNDCVEEMVTDADRVVLLLSPARILLEKEQQCLAEFQDREQARLRELEVPTS